MWTACKSTMKRATLHALGVVRKLTGPANEVLLTFDDGPHPDVTPAVLARLKRWRARAVFFVVGNRIARAPSLLSRILAEGHVIGNHTYDHCAGGQPSVAAYHRTVADCQQAVESCGGVRPSLFRPPQGCITLAGQSAAWAHGLRTVHWSVDPEDWRLRREEEARTCGDALKGRVGPRDVVLLHDDNPCVLTILDILLPDLSARGFDLESAAHRIESFSRRKPAS